MDRYFRRSACFSDNPSENYDYVFDMKVEPEQRFYAEFAQPVYPSIQPVRKESVEFPNATVCVVCAGISVISAVICFVSFVFSR